VALKWVKEKKIHTFGFIVKLIQHRSILLTQDNIGAFAGHIDIVAIPEELKWDRANCVTLGLGLTHIFFKLQSA
jgi:hypothetical protein